jgi:hypothetical protein
MSLTSRKQSSDLAEFLFLFQLLLLTVIVKVQTDSFTTSRAVLVLSCLLVFPSPSHLQHSQVCIDETFFCFVFCLFLAP